jgi:L-alanine-DL-glutamate epimerase-like enolase superfamily enzyme
VTYVNHTFKSHLQLAASLHVFAGVEQFRFLEYPDTPSPLARELTMTRLQRDNEGMVRAPEVPGLGLEVNLDTVRKYLQPVRIEVAGRVLFESGPI